MHGTLVSNRASLLNRKFASTFLRLICREKRSEHSFEYGDIIYFPNATNTNCESYIGSRRILMHTVYLLCISEAYASVYIE